MNNAKEPAFPIAGSWNDEHPQVIVPLNMGMTKREYFAITILQGLASIPIGNRTDTNAIIEGDSKIAVKYADLLLNELAKPITP